MEMRVRAWFVLASSAALVVACGGHSSNANGAMPNGGFGNAQAGLGGSHFGGAAMGGAAQQADAAGAGGLLEVSSTGTEPADERPPAPPWDPGFPLGTPGWQSSTSPLCPTTVGALTSLGVWADERGVFALTAHGCTRDRDAFVRDCKQTGLALQLNDGSGWSVIFSAGEDVSGTDISSAQLTGFPGAALLDLGTLQGKWGLFSIADGVAREQPFAGRVYVVDARTAYGVSDTQVYKFEHGVWNNFAEVPAAVSAVWADGKRVVVAGSDDAVFESSANSAAFTALPKVPLGTHSVVWGFDDHELWLSSDSQLSHYDGMNWNIVDTADAFGDSAISEAWGAEGVLFVRSQRALARVEGGRAQTLIPASATDGGLSLSGLFGRSPKEVFVSLENERDFAGYKCGGDFMLWFDGNAFHRF